MSNDWTIVPACGVDLNGDPGTGRADEPHCVVWNFANKKEAAEFAVFVETVHGKVQNNPDKLLDVMTEASMRLALALGNARTVLKAIQPFSPTLIAEALEKCDPCKVKLR